mgnify:CR=1 FL=1
MDSNKTKTVQKIMQNENKNLPNVISNESQTMSKEEQKETEMNSSQEKIYLEGEPHIDNTSLNSKKLKVMEQLIVKPREAYLKEKIEKINYNKNLLNNIQKDINNQVEDIKTQIKENKVSINEKTKDLNKLMENIKSIKEKNLIKNSDKEYNARKKHKILKELTEEQNILKTKLNKIEINESLLKSEGFMNLNNSYESEAITPFDKSIKEQQIKNIKIKKKEINERLIEIDFRINKIVQEEKDKIFSKKEKLDNYKQNFERDKELIEARAEKYLKETKERNKRISQDMEQLVEKRKKEIERREKEDEMKKKEILNKFIEKEKKIERQRLEEKKLIMEKYMPYRQLKCDLKIKDYTYSKLNKKFEDKENDLIKKVNKEKKLKSKMVTSEELKDFLEQIDTKKEEIKKKKELREQKEKEKYDEAKNFKPKYINKYNEQNDEELNNQINEKNNKKEIINGFIELKRNYVKKHVHQPSINEAKKKERLDNIAKIEQQKLLQVKYTLKKQERNKSKDKKSLEWLYKLKKDNEIKNLNNSAEMDNPISLIKKPKVVRLSSSFTKNKKKENVNPKQFNYLEELRNKKMIKHQNTFDNRDIIINDGKKSVEEIEQMKEKTQILEKKAQRGEELLRVNGGIMNNPQLGKQVSDMYINSIENKLKILNQIYDKYDN